MCKHEKRHVLCTDYFHILHKYIPSGVKGCQEKEYIISLELSTDVGVKHSKVVHV